MKYNIECPVEYKIDHCELKTFYRYLFKLSNDTILSLFIRVTKTNSDYNKPRGNRYYRDFALSFAIVDDYEFKDVHLDRYDFIDTNNGLKTLHEIMNCVQFGLLNVLNINENWVLYDIIIHPSNNKLVSNNQRFKMYDRFIKRLVKNYGMVLYDHGAKITDNGNYDLYYTVAEEIKYDVKNMSIDEILIDLYHIEKYSHIYNMITSIDDVDEYNIRDYISNLTKFVVSVLRTYDNILSIERAYSHYIWALSIRSKDFNKIMMCVKLDKLDWEELIL